MQRNWASPRFWSDTQLISALPVQSKIPQFSCGNCAGCSDLWRRLWCWRQCGRCCGQWWPPCPLPACPRPPARRWWCACCPLAPPTSAASDRYRPGRSDLPQSYKMKQYRYSVYTNRQAVRSSYHEEQCGGSRFLGWIRIPDPIQQNHWKKKISFFKRFI